MGDYKDRGAWGGNRRLILVLTNRGDFTADWLILELERRRANTLRFNTEDWPTGVRMVWTGDGLSQLKFGDSVIGAEGIRSVWFRRPVAPVLPEYEDAGYAAWALAECREALTGFWRTLDAFWVNPPLADAAASSKPEQIRRARRIGLPVPESVVTNDPAEAIAFASRGPTVCKPLSQGVLQSRGSESVFFTRLLSDADVDALTTLGPEPYLFQRLVQKRFDLRVIVIGGEAFGVSIDSQARDETKIDWRAGDATSLRHAVADMPAEVSEACVRILADYGLRFGAIDLAVDQDGRYVFFEINPAGQWAWIEQLTGLPLRSRLADLLESG